MSYKPVIGLEIHVELLTKSKLFCSCQNSFGGNENTRVCPVCTGMPGSLPMLNQEAVVLAVKAGLVTNCTIQNRSSFDRKNYFYPDLPKAYQITQNYEPICKNGHIGKIRINNIHIEEDAGKLIHKDDFSEIDLNRCGVPLIEIVTEPDFQSADEVCEFLDDLSKRLKYAKISDCKMEEGSLRVDVNISLTEDNQPGTRTELKNINSFKSIRRAIDYEIKRQTEILINCQKIIPQTRRFDEKSGKTYLMRTKEEVTDYRYFPEPDLPALFIPNNILEDIKITLPKSWYERFSYYVNELDLSEQDAKLITQDKDFSDFFESSLSFENLPKETAKLMLGELNHRLNLTGLNVLRLNFSPKDFSQLIKLETDKKINKNEQKEILKIMFETKDSLENILKTIKKEVSEDDLKNKILTLANENKKLVTDFKNGGTKCVDFFLGQIIRQFGKSLDPKAIKELIISILNEF